MIAKYKFEKFDFKSFQDFIWDLIGLYQIGQIKFTPHQKADLFNDHQLTHIGPVYNLDNPGDFLYAWSRNREFVRGVTYEQFHLNKTSRIIISYDIDEKSITIVSLEGISRKDVESSLKKFFKISGIADDNKWWKYTHPVWWTWFAVILVFRDGIWELLKIAWKHKLISGLILAIILPIIVGLCINYLTYRFGWNSPTSVNTK